MPPESAVAVREDTHPIIQKIDARMPEIAEMLPEGMDADRFRRVVVQALVRNPDLWNCTPVSVVSAIVESAQLGLEPTGVLGRAWMLPYAGEAKLIVGYRGYAELAWRADRILVKTGAVRVGDEFAYQRGTDAYLRHVPASDDPVREANDENITDFWALYQLPDGRTEFEVMSRKAVERIRDKIKYRNPVWVDHFGEMGRKTVLRRLLKVAPLSPEVQRVLGRDEEIDFDTPVARVADEKRDALRDRIAERTAAIRGEPEPSKRDPWMARLHAVGAERGLDHDTLHQWAVDMFNAESITELSPSQRADLMDAVERAPIQQPVQDQEAGGATPATPESVSQPVARAGDGPEPEATVPPDGGVPPAPATSPPDAAGDTEPPQPGTDAYKALPSGKDRAAARAYWDAKGDEPEQVSLAEALGAPEPAS